MTSYALVVSSGAVIGGLHLVAYYAGWRRTAAATKAIPIALLVLWVLAHAPAVGPTYRALVAVGLCFSMAGDLFLLSPVRFRAGLASFFVGHVCYVAAFVSGRPAFDAALGPLVVQALVAGAMLRVLWPHVGRERAPVACYVGIISLMAWIAIARALTPATPQPSGALAALGALVFLASDATLALDRFVGRWRGAHAAVMVTYYAAQMLIAGSVAA